MKIYKKKKREYLKNNFEVAPLVKNEMFNKCNNNNTKILMKIYENV